VRRRAFTMAELLVTVAVVAALLALLVPGLRAATAMARATACSSNLRQLATACTAYESANGALPAAILYFRDGADVRTVAWDFEQRGGEWSPGPLWAFISSPSDVQQCPDFLGPSTFGNDPHTGYNYNTTYIGAEGRFPEQDANGNWLDGWKVARQGLPSSRHRRTSTTALFGEGGFGGVSHPIQGLIADGSGLAVLLSFVLAAVAAPVGEEIAFRGALYRNLRDTFGRASPLVGAVVASLVGSVLFAAIHPQGFVFIPVLGGLALAFCISREWTGSINPAIVAHAINNAVMVGLNVVLLW